ncbi:hypothetical protein FH972_015203 [Carpinus fangiana]|uniref:ASCH domain-containing protein n=1 Tax=Carpinus fangiana TaxID=176857 RepID=A0A5N6RC35_9ROSI|nr:hypothetical protein FH972_015203 [Carpinus fangiana]
MSPVNLRDFMEELVRFTLESYIDETLEIDLGLSKAFCSNLLKDDPSDPYLATSADSFQGVPPYPLYKGLASSLLESIDSKAFCRSHCNLTLIPEGSSFKQKENEWQKLIMDKGSKIVNIMETSVHELHVQEPFFSQLKDGQKTIEGRCAVGDYNRIGSGSLILFNRCVVLEVQDVRRYASFSDMLGAETLANVLPGVETIEEGVQIYRKFYTEEKERSNGVLAIFVSKVDLQPYICLATLLSVVTLTHGARALAKHANRSSSKYWGTLEGSDSDKNKLAMDVVSHLIARCDWLNVHVVPPHGVVFEIRVADGYGARWSKDGSKFIGFLEPYMKDGHSKGWSH